MLKQKLLNLLRNQKGMGLGDVPGIFLTLVFIVTIGVAGYLILAGMDTSIPSSSVNYNMTHGAVGNFTKSFDNVISYAPTWGTIMGVGVLIAIVLGAFMYGKKLKGEY